MEHMKSLIADGVYKAGDKIPTEQQLAQDLGVGRSSIREAIKVFSYLGITESVASRGTFISDRTKIASEMLTWTLLLGHDEVENIIEFRGAVELWSFIQLTALHRSDPAKAEGYILRLKAELEQMQKAIDSLSRRQLISADYDFHQIIIEASENELFLSLYDVLRSFMMHEIEKTHNQYMLPQKIVDEHTVLLDAIKSGDIVTAEHAYRNHIENIKNLVKPAENQATVS